MVPWVVVGGGAPPDAEAGGVGLNDVLLPWVVVGGGPPPEAEAGDGLLIGVVLDDVLVP
jgi:hypothetical protein